MIPSISVKIYLRLGGTYHFNLQDDAANLKMEEIAPSEKLELFTGLHVVF
jgi:hypothetical protein